MKQDNAAWRMFYETGEPVCYLIYRSLLRDKKDGSNFPPRENLVFNGVDDESTNRF